MKKMLMALTTAGVLAVPFGVILAEDEPAEPSDPVSTCVEADRVRDRDRLHVEDGTPVGEQARECDGDAARTREREQNRLEDGTCTGPMVREREQNRLEDGAGAGPMVREREQNRLEDGAGDGPMVREREQNRLEDGTCDGPMVREREQNRLEEGTGTPAEDTPVGTDAATTVDGANLQFRYGAGVDRGGR